MVRDIGAQPAGGELDSQVEAVVALLVAESKFDAPETSPLSNSCSSLWQATPQTAARSRMAAGKGYGPRPRGSGEG